MSAEKKIAFTLHSLRCSLTLSKRSLAVSSYAKALTVLKPSIISSDIEVSSPLVADCSLNLLYVCFATNEETNIDRGVMTITAIVIFTLIENMKNIVPSIVTRPVKIWVKPMIRPSLTCSTSVVMMLM